MRFRLWGAAMVVVGIVALMITPVAAAPAHSAPAPRVTSFYLSSTGFTPVPTLGGITGIDRKPDGEYIMIASAGLGRYFDARIPFFSSTGAFGRATVSLAGRPILGPGFMPMMPGAAQFEGVRSRGNGFVVASGGAHQFVRLLGPFGNQVRDLPLPQAYRKAKNTGLDPRRGLIGVAVAPGSGMISTLTAGGLKQDPAHSARLLIWPGRGTTEFVYRTDGDKLAADVVAVNKTDYLVLERGKGRATRIFWTTTRGAQPVTGKARLSGREVAMPKVPIFSTAPLPGLRAGNMSGLGWGNWLPDRPWLKYRARVLFVVTNDGLGVPPRVHALEVRFPKR
ncbi:esterase-like activity of phytase family protein [Gordonia sp. NPDC003585]|uniref:esterase-like activity of phytase family protein n=1 Tax=unclassified Gordonia (in: high G+C Gram-positive bacteria) TaxID=2657482 RepID=UPI0033BA7D98